MIDKYGDDDAISGNRSIVNAKVMAEVKARRYTDAKASNPNVSQQLSIDLTFQFL
jgi:hypothetical protein